MRTLVFYATLIFSLSFAQVSFSRSYYPGDTLELKKWKKETFLKTFGHNDTTRALINLCFDKNKKGKNQLIIGGAFLTGGVIAMATPYEKNNDAKGFGDLIRPVAEPGALAIGAIFSTIGIIQLKKYSLKKLYYLLVDYFHEVPIPSQYSKKFRKKYFL